MFRRNLRKLDNRYIWAALAFTLWIVFFDRYNIIYRIRVAKEIKNVESQKKYYLNEIEKDKKSIKELTSDTASLEKFARETYLMKKDNEDVFLIIEEKKE